MVADYREWARQALEAPPRPFALRAGGAEDCVVSVAAGYPADVLKPLVRSLRANSAAALVVATERRPDMLQLAVEQRFDLWLVEPAGGYTPYPAFARLSTLLAILRALPDTVRRLILCDSRDVVFQSDPFAAFPASRIAFFAENDGTDGFSLATTNGRWVRLMLAAADAAALRGRPVVNAGVIMAERDAAIELCRRKIEFGLCVREWCRQTTGLDNISTNVVAHRGLVKGSAILPNHRTVANVLRGAAMSVNALGDIAGPDGRACPVVHMYDRLPALADHVRRRYGPMAEHRFDARRSVTKGGSLLREARHHLRIARLFVSSP